MGPTPEYPDSYLTQMTLKSPASSSVVTLSFKLWKVVPLCLGFLQLIQQQILSTWSHSVSSI